MCISWWKYQTTAAAWPWQAFEAATLVIFEVVLHQKTHREIKPKYQKSKFWSICYNKSCIYGSNMLIKNGFRQYWNNHGSLVPNVDAILGPEYDPLWRDAGVMDYHHWKSSLSQWSCMLIPHSILPNHTEGHQLNRRDALSRKGLRLGKDSAGVGVKNLLGQAVVWNTAGVGARTTVPWHGNLEWCL